MVILEDKHWVDRSALLKVEHINPPCSPRLSNQDYLRAPWANSSNNSGALATQKCVLQPHNFAKALKESTPSASESLGILPHPPQQGGGTPQGLPVFSFTLLRRMVSPALGHPPSATVPFPTSLPRPEPSQVSLPSQPTMSHHRYKSGDGGSDVHHLRLRVFCVDWG